MNTIKCKLDVEWVYKNAYKFNINNFNPNNFVRTKSMDVISFF